MWKDERDNKLLHCKHEHLSEFPSPSSKTKHALITPLTHVFLTSGQKTTRKFSPTPRYIHNAVDLQLRNTQHYPLESHEQLT